VEETVVPYNHDREVTQRPVVLRRYRITFTVLTVAVASFALLQSLVIPVLGTLADELNTDQATITWALTAYLLSASICTPLLGRLGDVVGKKRMLVLTLGALSIGSLMAALSSSVEWLILARVVQGAGGGVLPLSFGIIRDEFPREKVNSGLSIVASLAAAGFGIGIVVAGPIVDLLGYHWLFWLPMIATGLAALAALTLVPESPVCTPGRIPVLPALLLSAWLVALLLGLSQGNTWGWGSDRVLGLFAAAAILACIWIVTETRVPVPLIDMEMMRSRGSGRPTSSQHSSASACTRPSASCRSCSRHPPTSATASERASPSPDTSCCPAPSPAS
jgi:MFS family permease